MDADKATVSVNEAAHPGASKETSSTPIERVLRALLWAIGPKRSSDFITKLIDSGRIADAKVAINAMAEKPKDEEIFLLTDIQERVNLPSVIPSYQDLLDRLKEVTARRGAKAELARHVDASMSEVTLWISGKRVPNGDTTLRILQWVEDQECKPKSPADGGTPAGPQTRKKQNDHELPKSSPQPD